MSSFLQPINVPEFHQGFQNASFTPRSRARRNGISINCNASPTPCFDPFEQSFEEEEMTDHYQPDHQSTSSSNQLTINEDMILYLKQFSQQYQSNQSGSSNCQDDEAPLPTIQQHYQENEINPAYVDVSNPSSPDNFSDNFDPGNRADIYPSSAGSHTSWSGPENYVNHCHEVRSDPVFLSEQQGFFSC